jgi:glycosyltransferase involved in cell wall biosynthesis
LKLNNYVKLLGPTKNISEIMNSLDVHIQSSRSEGFPNVVAEAMAHKTPCVVTNLCIKLLERGDSIIGIDNHNDYYDPKIKEARFERLKKYSNYQHYRMIFVIKKI